MSVILTSFRESDNILKILPHAEAFSVARWQPKGYYYNALENLGAYDVNGNRLFLRNRTGNPLDGYKKDWLEYIAKNITWVDKWLKSLDNNKDIVLCCWCPYSQSTKKQIADHLTFACHTGIIGKMINKFRPDIQIYLDKDRHERLVEEWKPSDYKVI